MNCSGLDPASTGLTESSGGEGAARAANCFGSEIAQAAVRSLLIVFLAPGFDLIFCICQRPEHLRIEALFP